MKLNYSVLVSVLIEKHFKKGELYSKDFIISQVGCSKGYIKDILSMFLKKGVIKKIIIDKEAYYGLPETVERIYKCLRY
ncbi:MAG: hypothetical protein ACK4WJ_06350 [Endomicrobiia bacterium]